MGERNRGRFSPPALGGSSLLVAFAALCLTVFALLSLSTVRADQRLGDACVQAVTEYYAADCAAQEILSRLRAGETPQGVSVSYDGVYSYACPISDNQELAVEVRPEGLDWEAYTVLRWQAVSTGEWRANTDLNLWDGASFS